MNFDDIAIRSLLIVLVGLGVGAVLSKRTAATRHLVYAGLLLSIVLLPVLRQWGPTRSVPLETLPAPVRELAARIDSNPVVATADAAVQSGPALAADSHWPARLLISVWMLGSLLLIGRLFTGIALTAKLVRSGERLYLFGSEQYEIRVVKGVNVPATTWIGRQVILLPTNYESWPPERVRSVVLHEAAHIARRDWFVQFFGRVACALYWPNPLVWLANRRMVDLAEQAADDLVLQAGVTPSRYAEDLLQIARTVRLNRPALTIPMALKNDVGRRIEMVLDNNKRRGSVHLGGLALAALGFAALTIPAASLLLHRQGDESTLQYADLAGNKTVAGTEANGFVARLADGRKVELVQVSWLQRDGTVQAWRPNGVPIPPKDQLARAYHGPDEKDRLEFVYRVQAAGTVVHSGMDLANESRSPGRTEFFGEGLALRPGSDGNVTLVANMAIRQRGVADPTSFVFYIADGEGRTAATYSAATGAVTDDPDLGAGLTVTPNAASTTVAYDYAPTPFVYLADAVGITRSGKTVQPKPLSSKRVKGGLFRITDSFPRTADLAKIEVQLHDVRAVEMKGVHIRPNTFVTE